MFMMLCIMKIELLMKYMEKKIEIILGFLFV